MPSLTRYSPASKNKAIALLELLREQCLAPEEDTNIFKYQTGEFIIDITIPDDVLVYYDGPNGSAIEMYRITALELELLGITWEDELFVLKI